MKQSPRDSKDRKKVLTKARIHFAPRTKYMIESGSWVKESKRLGLLALSFLTGMVVTVTFNSGESITIRGGKKK